MNPKVIVVGSANTDFTVQIPHLPVKGETVIGGTFTTANGGKGANQAVAAARLGAEVTFVARLGSDNIGSEALESYHREGIHTGFIVRDPALASGVALILVGGAGENMIAVASGANWALCPEDVIQAESAIKDADCLLVQLEIPMETVLTAAKLAARHKVRVILNPAPGKEIPPELLRLVDILTPNKEEARILSGESSQSDNISVLFQLAQKTGVKNIIMTVGENGSLVYSDRRVTEVPGYQVTPVDTTACGDAFNGALAVALGRGQGIFQAVRYANAVGAMAATKLGAQPSLPTAHEVDNFLADLQ